MATIPSADCDRSKQLENVAYFNRLGSKITDNARCTHEIISRTAVEKASLGKKKTPFTSKLDLNFRKKLVVCYIGSIALYGAEIWTLQKVDQKYLKVLKYAAGEGRRRSVGLII